VRLSSAWLVWSLATSAHAQPSFDQALVSNAPLLVRLAPTPSALHEARLRALEAELTRMLRALPDVVEVTAHVWLPIASEHPLSAPLPRARIAIALARRAQAAPASALSAQVSRLCRALSPALTDAQIELVESVVTPAKPASALVQIGPFRVEESAATALRLTLGLSLFANVLLAGWVLFRARPHRPAERKVDRRGHHDNPP
jgi:type III secretory pathway lipoprotein EscJ